MRVEDQAGDIVFGGVEEGGVDDLAEGDVGQGELGSDPFALGRSGDSGEGVSGFLFVGLGEERAEVWEVKDFAADGGFAGHLDSNV